MGRMTLPPLQYTQLKRGFAWGLIGKDRNRLDQDACIQTRLRGVVAQSKDGFIRLTSDGMLYILEGWEWDGASGPTLDTESTMWGSLGHDALYSLLSEGALDIEHKPDCDAMLWVLLRYGGTGPKRAAYWLLAVDTWGGKHIGGES